MVAPGPGGGCVWLFREGMRGCSWGGVHGFFGGMHGFSGGRAWFFPGEVRVFFWVGHA